METIGEIGKNSRLFSLSGSVRLLRSGTQPLERIMERASHFQLDLLNGHKSTRKPYGKEETYNLSEVSRFLFR